MHQPGAVPAKKITNLQGVPNWYSLQNYSVVLWL